MARHVMSAGKLYVDHHFGGERVVVLECYGSVAVYLGLCRYCYWYEGRKRNDNELGDPSCQSIEK